MLTEPATDRLLEEGRKLGGRRTKGEAPRAALNECVLRQKQMKLLTVFGNHGLRFSLYKYEWTKRL